MLTNKLRTRNRTVDVCEMVLDDSLGDGGVRDDRLAESGQCDVVRGCATGDGDSPRCAHLKGPGDIGADGECRLIRRCGDTLCCLSL